MIEDARGCADTGAESRSRWPQPGELWSLWKLMIQYEIPEFVELGETLTEVRELYVYSKAMGVIDDSKKSEVSVAIRAMSSLAAKMRMRALENQLDRYEANVPYTVEAWDMLVDSFMSNMETAVLFLVPTDRQKFFEDKSPFGRPVELSFKPLLDEIECARLCLGYGQPTASVFHMMRVMEGAVSLLAKQLQLPDTTLEWGKLLSGIDAKIKDMAKDDDRKKWSERRAHLWHVKECWRNDTMHPRRSYSQTQAEELFSAVGVFMRSLVILTPEGNTTVAKILREAAGED
ncbi:MAG: hypothetical protein KKF36_09490 [Alphaproteobacteria bacterium]|nr:hypothetical protein [Alphaproteobacteria bacterium]